MPIDVQRLAEVVRVFNQARTDPEPSGPDALERVREDLRGLAREALDDDPEMIPVVVNLIHLLLEVRDGAVPEDAAAEGLGRLESSLSRGFLAQDWAELMVPLVLRGGDIEEAPGSDDRAGCSLMRSALLLRSPCRRLWQDQVQLDRPGGSLGSGRTWQDRGAGERAPSRRAQPGGLVHG